MKNRHRLFILLACFLFVNSFLISSSHLNANRQTTAGKVSPGQVFPGVVLIKFKRGVVVTEGTTPANVGSLDMVMSKVHASSLSKVFKQLKPVSDPEAIAGKVDLSNIFYLYIDQSFDPREAARILSSVNEIEYAEPKYVHYLYDIPNDPQLSNQTSAFTRMNAFNGWSIAKGDSTVVIADVDGGTAWHHQDLLPNLWINSAEDINHNGRFDPGPPPAGDEDGIDQDGNGFTDDVIGWNFSNNSNDPTGLVATPVSAEHGTETASIFGARTNNGIGIAGSSWNCSLMSICAASPIEDGFMAFPYEGITYAYLNGARVINCSFGRPGNFSQFEQDVITAAAQAGALVVASAGNGTNNNGVSKNNDIIPDYPAHYKYVLCVGATSSTSDVKASFSNYGVSVQVYAPGVNIWTASPSNDSAYENGGSGTSLSAPLVSGLAGIVQSLHPAWTPSQVAAQIRVTSDTIEYANNVSLSGKLGHGRVNFARALTESHPGIEILTSTILNTKGSKVFLPGDTVVLSMSVKNILFASASSLTFTATTSDTSLQVLVGTQFIYSLGPGAQILVPDFRFLVKPLSVSKDIAIKLSWVSNTNERDAYSFKVAVFPSTPFWVTQNSPTQTSLACIRAVSQSVVWAGGGATNGSSPVVIRTTDAGATWTLATGNLSGVNIVSISATDELRCWIGTDNGRIFATTNGGTSWVQQTYPGTQASFIDGVWFFDANTGYVLGDPPSNNKYVILQTTNGGQAWSHVANEPAGTFNTEYGWNNSFWWTDLNHGWFGTNVNKILRTTDGGATWSSGSTGSNADTYGVSFKDANNGIAVHSNGGISVSTNGGATWTGITSPTANPLIGVSYQAGTNFAWVADFANPFRTVNNGSTWGKQSLYPFSGGIQHLSFSDTLHGWAVTSDGEVLAYNPLLTSVDGPPSGITPMKFSLAQNYPNPFNPVTTIRYHVPVFGKVLLKVYDILGREITTLVNADQYPGEHTVVFDASHLSSGVYFYRLMAAEFTQVRKLMVIR